MFVGYRNTLSKLRNTEYEQYLSKSKIFDSEIHQQLGLQWI